MFRPKASSARAEAGADGTATVIGAGMVPGMLAIDMPQFAPPSYGAYSIDKRL